jgi:hypothetical protein
MHRGRGMYGSHCTMRKRTTELCPHHHSAATRLIAQAARSNKRDFQSGTEIQGATVATRALDASAARSKPTLHCTKSAS